MKNQITGREKVFLITLATLLALSMPVLADQCITSVDATTSVTSNVTTGTNVQISATPSGSCSSGEVTLQLTYSNCSLTITDPSSPGYYSGINTGTAQTFTATTGSAGICTVTARGTTSDGSVDSNTPIILEFIDPAALTIAGTTSASVTFGSTFNLGINISNPQTSDTLTSYTLTLPSGLTRSSGDLLVNPSITADAGGTKPLSWVISHSTCFTGSKTITLQVGDNSNAFSLSVAGNSSCSSGSSSSGSGSGGAGAGSNSTATVNETKLFTTTPGASTILPFLQITSPGITQMEIKTTGAVSGLQVSLAASIKPFGAADIVSSSNGKVYSYADITSNQDDSVFSLIKIKFKVPTVWISANDIDYTKLYLYRYANSNWNRLDTTFKSNDSSNFFYEATTPGFSTYAVTGFKANATVPANPGSMSVTIIDPSSGLIVRNTTVTVKLSATGVTLADPRTTYVAGEGHFHLWLDNGSEQDGAQTTFTYTNLSEGNHTIKAELRRSDGNSFSPAVLATVTFSVEPLKEQGAPFAFPADMTMYAIVGVIIVVIIGGAYFAVSKRGEFSMPRISRRTMRQFSDRLGDVSSAASRISTRRRYSDRSFSRGYEYRGESNYSSYNPDSIEKNGKDDDELG